MTECQKKGGPHRHFFQLSAASVQHRHSGIRVQSGTAGHGLVRYCPAMLVGRQQCGSAGCVSNPIRLLNAGVLDYPAFGQAGTQMNKNDDAGTSMVPV